ncbi:MAG: hypothetical protein ACHQ52_07125 [Candidatus Eisenbacteria bacterium]
MPARRRRSTPRGAPIRAAFDQGQIPTIASFNQAKTPLGVDLDRLLAALQEYVDRHVAPVWGTPCHLVRSTGFVKDCWALQFLDESDEQGALAYHDLTPDGLPLSKVFVKTILDNGDSVSNAASHELVEMLVDPAINLLSTGPDQKAAYCYESADPVEEVSFNVQGLPMSDFVYPSYFEIFHRPGSTRFDHAGQVTRPFQLLKGGYQIVFKNGKWSNVFGSKAKAARFRREDRREHRSEQRGAPLRRVRARSWGRVVERF